MKMTLYKLENECGKMNLVVTNMDDNMKLFLAQAKALIEYESDLIANLANLAALIKEHYGPRCSWAGFYLMKEKELVLGPFQGKPACTRIPVGKGVCGTAALSQKTQIVPNVHDFPGHIACDGGSNSEIVVNLLKDGKCLGVIDLDSYQFDAFSENDAVMLEHLAQIVCQLLE